MVNREILRHLLCDKLSLDSYAAGLPVQFVDIKRRLLLCERMEDRNLPDHHYRLQLEVSFLDIKDTSDVLTQGLSGLASQYLSISDKKIYVRPELQNDWQEILTYLPPLVLQAAVLAEHFPLNSEKIDDIIFYYNTYVLENVKYTALPKAVFPGLSELAEDWGGFHDLHMHLNGSTETDNAWQDYLATPHKIYTEMQAAFSVEMVREHLEQESHLLVPVQFQRMLLAARNIRGILCDWVMGIRGKDAAFNSLSSLLLALNDDVRRDLDPGPIHPITGVLSGHSGDAFPIASECLLYVMLFSKLRRSKEEPIVSLLHYYLLILGLANRLLVQQKHQFGFEQFQKHTLNGLREHSELTFLNRFLQMQGNGLNNINFLESRFSPKSSQIELAKSLKLIESGWSAHLLRIERSYGTGIRRGSLPEIKLIAHFIKKADRSPDVYIRHKMLRMEVWEKAKVLWLIHGKGIAFADRIVGIDAASSEFDAPPEVFAPSFRKLRRMGYAYFTYHSGEDFHHLLSGLRAVYEAITFNDFECGDRIGHATATGLSSLQWVQAMGEVMFIRSGEWLDDLVFAYHLVTLDGGSSLQSILPSLEKGILTGAREIFSEDVKIEDLICAWRLRKYCPILLFSTDRADARSRSVFDEEEWVDIQRETISEKVKNLVQHYHDLSNREAYHKIVQISPGEIFGADGLEELQMLVLKLMSDSGIVIETLPTSNVRIGHHRDFQTYHLWNWIRWSEAGKPVPQIIVGTDDTGIFATNILNEYANILSGLTKSRSVYDSLKVLKELNQNALDYRFE